MMEIGFTPAPEYASLPHLQLGDVGSAKAVCTIWNSLHRKDSVQVVEVVERESRIVVSGFVEDAETLYNTLKYYCSIGTCIDLQVTRLEMVTERF